MVKIDKLKRITTDNNNWQRIANQDNTTTIFQSPDWINLEVKDPSVKNLTTLARTEDKRTVILPLTIRAHDHPFKGKIIRYISSGRLGIYGGTISDSELTEKERVELIEQIFKNVSPKFKPSKLIFNRNPLTSSKGDNFTQMVKTDKNFDRVLENHKKQARNCYRQPRDNENIQIVREGENILERFYRLYEQNLERWDNPTTVYSKSTYQKIMDVLPDEKREMKIVEHSEHGDIGGILNIKHNKHTYMFMNCMDYEHRDFYPNNYSITSSLKSAAEGETDYFDFGSSSGIEGLVKFKESFGSEKYYFSEVERNSNAFDILESSMEKMKYIR